MEGSFRRDSSAVQLSGGMSLQLCPSDVGYPFFFGGRVESGYVLTLAPGKKTVIEASIGFGKNHNGSKEDFYSDFGLLAQAAGHTESWLNRKEHTDLRIMEADNFRLKAASRAGCVENEPWSRRNSEYRILPSAPDQVQ